MMMMINPFVVVVVLMLVAKDVSLKKIKKRTKRSFVVLSSTVYIFLVYE